MRNANEARNLYKEECRKIGIAGEKVGKELIHLVENLPNEFDEIAKQTLEISDVIEFYATFVEFTLGR